MSEKRLFERVIVAQYDGGDLCYHLDWKAVRRAGDEWARGVIDQISRWVLLWVVLALVLLLIGQTTTIFPTDSTDDGPGHRSAFILRTDYGTGCEYLEIGSTITPRLNGAGKHMGCRP